MVWANQILPGQSGISPDAFPTLGSTATVIADSGLLSYSFDGGLTYGKYEEYVATDTANPFCSGCLDFGFIITVTDPNDFITALKVAFPGVKTDGGYFNDLSSSQIDPSAMARGTGPGEGVQFSLDVLPGDTSAIVVVKTNATTFDDQGGAVLSDSNNHQHFVADYEPTPEPSTLVLTGLCFFAVVLRRAFV